MRAVRRLVTYRLAAGWPGLVVLVLLVGLAGGAVLTAVAGARRTASAYPRFLVASRASDVLAAPAGSGLRGYDNALASLPGVAAIAPMVGLQANRSDQAASWTSRLWSARRWTADSAICWRSRSYSPGVSRSQITQPR